MWKYSNAVFTCDKYNKEMLRYAPWSGHRRFIYDYFINLRPELCVELGSFYGCSTFAMGQAIIDGGLSSKVWAVDIWEAFEDYTSHSYQENIYESFLRVGKVCGLEQVIIPLKMTFSEARNKFEEKSIDLLHIDGSHHYEDVKRDFEEWLPAVKEDGVILFHDIGENIINGEKMGSHFFWQELKEVYKDTLQFDFSCGLGILCLSNKTKKFLETVDLCYYQNQNNLDDAEYKDELCKMSFEIRDKELYIEDLVNQINIKEAHLNKYAEDRILLQQAYESTISEKDKYIHYLENEKEQLQKIWEEERKKIQKDYEKTIEGKDCYISELELQLKK